MEKAYQSDEHQTKQPKPEWAVVETLTTASPAALTSALPAKRCLLTREQVQESLQLKPEIVQWLVDTSQLQPIQIRGQERFDSKDVIGLIESYKFVQGRRN